MAELPGARLRVARNVRRLRLLRRLSQERLAELAGNTAKHVGQIERAEVNVSVDILDGIAGALEVDVADLFGPAKRRKRGDANLFVLNPSLPDQLDEIARAIRAGRIRPSDSDI